MTTIYIATIYIYQLAFSEQIEPQMSAVSLLIPLSKMTNLYMFLYDILL